jgi:hypothetical protein
MNKLVVLCLFLFTGLAQGAPVTVDFQEYCCLPDGGIIQPVPDPVTAGGFTFGGGSVGVYPGASGLILTYNVGTNYSPIAESFVSHTTFERTDGEAFALHTLNWEIWNGYHENAEFYIDISFVGYLAGGGTVTATDRSEIGQGDWLNIVGAAIFTTGPTWTGSDPDWEMYNSRLNSMIVGTAVPVPAAVWLFGSALLTAGAIRKQSLTGNTKT